MDNRYRVACVTGGAGFIGRHLVRALLARGIAVTVLDNMSVGNAQGLPAAARLVKGDILDPSAVRHALEGCDLIFHLAARVAIRSSFDFVVEDTMTNVVGTASVLRAARQCGSVRKIITTSSMAVYADTPSPTPVTESHRTASISPYGISKLAAERLTHSMCATAGLDSVVLRLFNTYGPGQALSPYVGVVTIFVNKIRQNESPVIFGDGEQCRDFVHVEDVVAGFIAAMDAPVTGETFNIGSGVPRTVNWVLERINQVMGTSFPGRHVDPVPGELRNSIADIGKARRILAFEPRRMFDTSIVEVVGQSLALEELHLGPSNPVVAM
jgi:nucleoside-diphosphate-sugar epimerase